MIALTGIELSKRVAELYKVRPQTLFYRTLPPVWLHEDDARCFQLMVEHGINLDWGYSAVSGPGLYSAIYLKGIESDDVRQAILQCLVKMKEGE